MADAPDDEAARLAAALERIARAGARLRDRRSGESEGAGAQGEAVARIDALIAELRSLLGVEAPVSGERRL